LQTAFVIILAPDGLHTPPDLENYTRHRYSSRLGAKEANLHAAVSNGHSVSLIQYISPPFIFIYCQLH
jgi:hypothetical protein